MSQKYNLQTEGTIRPASDSFADLHKWWRLKRTSLTCGYIETCPVRGRISEAFLSRSLWSTHQWHFRRIRVYVNDSKAVHEVIDIWPSCVRRHARPYHVDCNTGIAAHSWQRLWAERELSMGINHNVLCEKHRLCYSSWSACIVLHPSSVPMVRCCSPPPNH